MRCVVSNCGHDSNQTPQEITFHRFPTEAGLRAVWLKELRMTELELEEQSAVCSSHFIKDDFLVCSSGLCTLRTGSVPAIHVQFTKPSTFLCIYKILIQSQLEYAVAVWNPYYKKYNDAIESVQNKFLKQVCRICFDQEFKLYSMTSYKVLYQAYEHLTGLVLENEDNLPPYLCSKCACQLLKWARFRNSSLQAHLILIEIIKKHGSITQELIQSVKGPCSPNANQTNHDGLEDLDIKLIADNMLYNNGPINIKHFADWHFDDSLKTDMVKNEVKREIYDYQDCTNDDMECMPILVKKINCIKTKTEDVPNKYSCHVEDTTMNDKSTLPIDLDESGIMNEEDLSHHKGYNTDDTTENNPVYVSSLPKVFIMDRVKVKNEFEINHNIIAEDITSVDVCLTKEITDDGAKTQKSCISNQSNAFEKCSSGAIDCEDVFVDYSFSVAEETQEAKQDISDVQKSTKMLEDSIQASDNKGLNKDAESGHLINDKFSCDLCPYQTNRELQLLSHLKAHAASVTYNCNMCSYITLRSRNLKCHVKIHNSEKTFTCDICQKKFKEKFILTKHMKIHSSVKPYSCDVCYKSFHEKCDFATHMSTHSGIRPYSCNVCDKAFARKSNLKTHLRTHSGEKPFPCNVCNKSFTVKSTLTKHMRLHDGVKPYSCDICFKAFTARFSLSSHMSKHF